MKKSYSEQDIAVLKGLEPVQVRPGMYTNTENPNHIFQEVIDNAQDEALAGFASKISVTLHDDGAVTIEDNGRGIPVGKHPTEGRPTVEVIFTTLHSGGKFKKGEGQTYGFTGGLHGVGVSVTNALSTRLEATVWRDGFEHTLAFENGAVVEPLKKKALSKEEKGKTGTRVKAWPNPKYFESPTLAVNVFENYLHAKAVLLPGVTVIWQKPNKDPIEWCFTNGLEEYLSDQSQDADWVAPLFVTSLYHEETSTHFEKGEGFELALGWNGARPVRQSYVNLIPTRDGGRHETGLRAGILDAFRKEAERTGALPKNVKLEGDDVWSSVSFVLSAKLMDPQFQNQTKDKMTSEKGHRLVSGLLSDELELWLNEHPQHAKALLEVFVQNALSRTRSSVKVERKRSASGMVLPGKLADCLGNDLSTSELFLVEGDSAAGCLSENVLVPLLDGRLVSFPTLIEEHKQGKENFCYTIKNDGTVGVGEIHHPRITKHGAEIVAVHLDNGKVIEATPDHRFMLRDGTYCPAVDLIVGNELMSLDINDVRYDSFSSASALEASYKVTSVATVSGWHDVYDIEIPGTHNFAVEGGVFVHNSGKSARDKETQAILPLRGKLLNTWEVDHHRLMSSEGVANIASAIGVDPHSMSQVDTVDMSKLRYGKVFIMADADVDGQHIQCLLLTLFFKHFPALVKGGHIWIAQAPLFRIDAPAKKGTKTGPRKIYALDDDERASVIKNLEKEGLKEGQYVVSRFKGLGEMNADQLGETTMNRDSRRALRITMGDVDRVNKAFDRMMGAKNAQARKEWMEAEGADIDID